MSDKDAAERIGEAIAATIKDERAKRRVLSQLRHSFRDETVATVAPAPAGTIYEAAHSESDFPTLQALNSVARSFGLGGGIAHVTTNGVERGAVAEGDIVELVRRVFDSAGMPDEDRRRHLDGFERVTSGGASSYSASSTPRDASTPTTITLRGPDKTATQRARLELLALAEAPELRIGKVDASAAHHVAETMQAQRLLYTSINLPEGHEGAVIEFDQGHQFYLIRHDWAAALATAEDYGPGEYRLPSESSVFEGRINGTRFLADIVTYALRDRDPRPCAFLFFETREGWAILHSYFIDGARWICSESPLTPYLATMQRVVDYLADQVRGICNALDAEIAVAEVVRAPHKLNRARERSGKLPLYEFHTVDLSRRRRLEPAEDGHEPGTPRRWHYVRGHWRHYASHKTWIRPHFRGNIDLGIIDKQYRL